MLERSLKPEAKQSARCGASCGRENEETTSTTDKKSVGKKTETAKDRQGAWPEKTSSGHRGGCESVCTRYGADGLTSC